MVLCHHAQGLTPGIEAFADRLRSAGHVVTVPDLFDGATFDTVEEGVSYAEELGFVEIVRRGEAAVTDLPSDLVYGGISLGAMPALKLAQSRPGTRGVVLCHGAVPLSVFGGVWPGGVPLQMHAHERDELSEPDVLHDLARAVQGAELYLYPGADHLFTDASLDAYDAVATALVIERTVALLRRVG